MQISKLAGVVVAGCGFLLLLNTALILLVLYIIVAGQSPAGRQSLESFLASLAQNAPEEQDTSRPVLATVAVLATEVQALSLRMDAPAPARSLPARETSIDIQATAPDPSPTSVPTNTSRPTTTPSLTATARPTATSTPTIDINQPTTSYFVVTSSHANARSCPLTSCGVVARFLAGVEVEVLQEVPGETVNGDTTWQALKYGDDVVFIHASLAQMATPTPRPTATPRPTTTPRPTSTTVRRAVSRAPAVNPNQSTTLYYVIAPARANARSCPQTSCSVVTSFARGATVNVLQRVAGQSVSGSSTWQAVKHGSQVVYVHGPLLSRNRPAPVSAPVQQAGSGQGQAGAPVAQPAADSRPAYPGMSCTAIRQQYNDGNFRPGHPAYNTGRDRDGDGIACEL